MADLKLPSILGDSRLDTVLLIFQNTKSGGAQRVSWSRIETILPAGYAILACLCDKAVEQQCSLKNVFVKKRFKHFPVIQALLSNNDLRTLPAPESYNSGTESFKLSGQETQLNLSFLEQVEHQFEQQLVDDLAYAVRLVLTELMTNAVDHSGAERYYMYAGLQKNEFHAGVLDMGVTIPARLEQKYFAEDDVSYLEKALTEGVGTRRKRLGGFGLTNIFDVLKDHKGRLTILSRRGFIRRYFGSDNIQKGLLKHRLDGTWCFARFPVQ